MRLIDADELKINLLSNADKFALKNPRFAFMLMIVVDLINIMDTIEAEPVRHGKWERPTNSKIARYCSLCGTRHILGSANNFCPNCGAKIDGGIPDETVHDKK